MTTQPNEALVEAVSDALYEAFGGDIGRSNMPHVARAIIPIVQKSNAEYLRDLAATGHECYEHVLLDAADAIERGEHHTLLRG